VACNLPKNCFFENILNIMSWKPFSGKSLVSGEKFEPGQRVVCMIFEHISGQLERIDLALEEANQCAVAGKLLGKWVKVVPTEKTGATHQDRQQGLLSAQELFWALAESENTATSEDKGALLQLLALSLERKRKLRRLEKMDADSPESEDLISVQCYEDPKTLARALVPMCHFPPNVMLGAGEKLKELMRL
jgi:hypothetical protein